MKKIALFSLMCCFGMINAYGANQCETSIPFKIGNNNWNAGSDEYLFKNERDYMNAVNTGWFYECDDDAGDCPDNSYVEVNSKHVFEGKTIHRAAKYKCSVNALNDKWEEVSDVKGLTKCTKPQRWKDGNLFANAEADEYLYPTVEDYNALKSLNYPQVYECDSSVCTDGEIITLPAGHYFKRNRINTQRKYKCVLGDPGNDKWVDITDDCKDCGDKVKPQPNPNTKTCEEDGKTYNIGDIIEDNKDCTKLSHPLLKTGVKCQKKCYSTPTGVGAVWGIKECPKNSTPIKMSNTAASGYNPKFVLYTECHSSKPVDPVKQKSCKDSRKTQTGKACCDVPESVATYDEKTDKCNCLVPNTVFDIVQGKGQCVAKDATPVVEGECEYYFTGSIECANGNQYFEKAKIKLPKSEIGKECGTDILKADVTRVMEIMKTLCKPADNFVILPEDDKVKKAQEVLSAFAASAKDEASVWKTAEGKFNTTRLASDITAGVVLGTVGGVVTGNIIKKNQVKKGFEALHCTVGGQKIADWGDEFSVGLRR